MAHWFHRNPLKATKEVKFDLKGVLTSSQAMKIAGELRMRREQLLEHLRTASSDFSMVETEFHDYLSLLGGFLSPISVPGTQPSNGTSPTSMPGTQPSNGTSPVSMPGTQPSTGTSKLAPLIRFKWSNSMQGTLANEMSDAWFEALNMCLNAAIWYTKYAAYVAGKDEVREDEAKSVHSALRKAAGIFQFVKDNADKVAGATSLTGSDLDPNVLSAYINQCIAEAQEVTVARAIELKHSPGLISALANHTAQLFENADKTLQNFDETTFGKWRRYLQLKAQFYLAYSFAFQGEAMLAEDKCGEAVRACKEGMTCYNLAMDFASKYSKAPGPGFTAKPEEHLFFRRIEPLLKRHLDKAERENGFIYHQKVPDECPQLPEKATFGLVKFDSYQLPPPSPLWNKAVYDSFDVNKAQMPDFSKIKKSAKDLPPVKEEKIYQTDRDPTNTSGCVIA